jgi:hypothetical protein
LLISPQDERASLLTPALATTRPGDDRRTSRRLNEASGRRDFAALIASTTRFPSAAWSIRPVSAIDWIERVRGEGEPELAVAIVRTAERAKA